MAERDNRQWSKDRPGLMTLRQRLRRTLHNDTKRTVRLGRITDSAYFDERHPQISDDDVYYPGMQDT